MIMSWDETTGLNEMLFTSERAVVHGLVLLLLWRKWDEDLGSDRYERLHRRFGLLAPPAARRRPLIDTQSPSSHDNA